MKVRLCGEIMSNGWARLYRKLGFDVCCPADVLSAIERCRDGEELVVEINSGGGSAYQGFDMYSALRAYKGRTVAEVGSIAASAASVVMAGCDTVRMSPVANVMIHRASTSAWGNSEAMRAARQMLDTIDESILTAYETKVSGKTERDTLARMMRSETFLTAQRAIELGLADELMGTGTEDGALTASAVASAEGTGRAELPRPEDILKLAKAAGIDTRDVEGQDRAGEPSARFVYKNTPTGQQKEEETNMDIKTVEDLRAAYPALVAEIEQSAAAAAADGERARIRAIDDMTMPGSEALATKAKFEEPMSAEAFAMEAMRAAKKQAAEQASAYLNGAKADAAGTDQVQQTTPQTSDEFLAAIKAVNEQ